MSDAGDPGTPTPAANVPHPTGDAPGSDNIDLHAPGVEACLKRYWRSNVIYMVVLLLIWAWVGLGCGVLFADKLNSFSIGGYPLGFWFAQQGSIITFVLIILVYATLMNRLDKKHHEELTRLRNGDSEAATPSASASEGGDA